MRFGVLGCGRIAERHSDLLGGGHIAGAKLVAVCDEARERADAIASRFGVPALYDLDDLLARKDIDAVSVLTPSGMHPRHAIAVAKAGKHVIVEKPMALRLEDADAMIRACDRAGVKLFVVKQNRFNVPVAKAREALEARRFRRLVLGTVRVRWCRDQSYYDQDKWRGTWAYDGGVLSNQPSHHVDMLEWFFGDGGSVRRSAGTREHCSGIGAAPVDRARRGRNAEVCSPGLRSRWIAVSEPDIRHFGVRGVQCGTRVSIVEPCNLYGCETGDDCFIGPFTEIQKTARVGARTRVQSHAFICELVTIGEDCFIGHGVMFINDTFSTGGPAPRRKELWRSTTIGNRVSIGSGATVLPVTICDDVVVGAGAVVTKDITVPGSYAGNPARLLARR